MVIVEGIDVGNIAQYGVLGLWTLALLVEKFTTANKLKEAVDNNTNMLTKISVVLDKK